jgi:predicted metal-binding protein
MSGKCNKCAEEEDKNEKEWKGISLLQKLEVPGSSWTRERVFSSPSINLLLHCALGIVL